MKILGVVTLVSPNGEYGGPVRVAVNQLKALRDRGHEVMLAGAYRGFDTAPTEVDSIPAKLFPARTLVPGTGFAGLAAPGLWRALHRHAREFDVIHVHAARDLVTLPAARIAQWRGVRTVVQTHGMIDETANPLAVPLDALLTRPVLHAAASVAFLTQTERTSLDVVSRRRAHLEEVPNGVPPAEEATADEGTTHALYLARLAPRKRPRMFVDAAAEVARDLPDAEFTLIGPDEGEGAAVSDGIERSGSTRIRWNGALPPEETSAAMRGATLYVLPSVDEPYPMSVLEAMSVGLPVIVTDTCGLASFIEEHDAGIVVDASQEALTAAMRTLLADGREARRRGDNARRAVLTERGMDAIASRLELLYR